MGRSKYDENRCVISWRWLCSSCHWNFCSNLRLLTVKDISRSLSADVEIIAPKGTQVFARLPGEDENLLGEAPLTVDVRVDATIILRCEDKEKTYLPDSWRNGRINEPSFCPDPPPPRPRVVSVSINAVPWAKVFIKLPKAWLHKTAENTFHYTSRFPRKNPTLRRYEAA